MNCILGSDDGWGSSPIQKSSIEKEKQELHRIQASPFSQNSVEVHGVMRQSLTALTHRRRLGPGGGRTRPP